MASNENYERITSGIIALIEKGGLMPWQKPWSGADYARSMSSGKLYNGINRWMLTATADAFGWSPWFGTYKQIEALGGQVRKGEKSSLAILWKPMERVNADGDKERFLLMRVFNVFSASQADGLPEKFYAKPSEHEVTDTGDAEEVFTDYLEREGIELLFGSAAYYVPATDQITLPCVESFISTDHYYAAAFHEAAHSTGAESRLNRPGITELNRGDIHQYSREELVAEFGSALVLGSLGLDKPSLVENQAAYLASWKRFLTDDPQALVWAAGRAEKAANMILGIEAKTEEVQA